MRAQAFATALIVSTAGLALAAEPTPAALESVEVTEHLGEVVPLSLPFTDSTGRELPLREYFDGQRPVVLILAYYNCPMLCNLVISGTVTALKGSGLKLGRDFRVVTLSIDPSETAQLAADRKRGHLQALGEAATDHNWAFMTGAPSQIARLAQSVGFGYAYDADTKQFAHAAVVFVLTPDGRISRYLYGLEYAPRDMKLALVEASGGRVGTSLDRVLLTCFKYDAALRRYAFVVNGVLRGGALLVFVMLSSMLVVLWRRETRRPT